MWSAKEAEHLDRNALVISFLKIVYAFICILAKLVCGPKPPPKSRLPLLLFCVEKHVDNCLLHWKPLNIDHLPPEARLLSEDG